MNIYLAQQDNFMIPKVKLAKSAWKTAYHVNLKQSVKDVLKAMSLTHKYQNAK